MRGTERSSNPLREGFDTFRESWYKALGLFALPVLGIGVILFFGNISAYLSLLLFPLMVPFLYNAYRFFWTSRDASGSKLSFSFSEYTNRPGARGSLGVLSPVLWGAIVTDLSYTLLLSTALIPLLSAFGRQDVANSIETILSIQGTSTLDQLLEYLEQPGVLEAFSGPLTVINGVSLYIGIVMMLVLCEKNRFNYVMMCRVLPDCDANLVGTQARILGKGYLRGLYWKRIGMKAKATVPMFVILTAIYAGAIAGFSFVNTSTPTLTGALPVLVTSPFAIIYFAIDASFDVPLADALIPDLIRNNPTGLLEPVRNTFHSPEYNHTADRAGQVPFQGLDYPGKATAADFDATEGFYRSSAADTPVQKTEEEPSAHESEKTGSYGVIDFSKLDGKDQDDGNGKAE